MDHRISRVFIVLLLLTAAVAAIHLMPGLDGSRVESEIRNALHVVGFAGVAAVVYEIIPFGRFAKITIAFLVAVAAGIASEYLQRFTGHHSDLSDLYRDMAGAGIYLFAYLLWSWSSATKLGSESRFFLKGLALLIGLLVFAPLVYWTGVFVVARAQSPIVLDFDSQFAPHHYFAINSEIALTEYQSDSGDSDANRYADIVLSGWYRSGIAVQTAIFDWSEFNALVFEATIVSGQPTTLTVHINDYANIGHFVDVESGTVTVTASALEYRIPIHSVLGKTGRDEDVADIRQVVLLARDRRVGTRMRIDNIRLE